MLHCYGDGSLEEFYEEYQQVVPVFSMKPFFHSPFSHLLCLAVKYFS
jgi:hypothetical protein